jgi:NAD(P)H-quinone oxidoreductase subunit 5
VSTRLVWLLWVASLGVLAAVSAGVASVDAFGIRVDGLTAVMWTAVTFFSGIVHSYSRRYMAGDAHVDRFFGLVFGFTIAVMVLVAADAFALFVLAWLAMGAAMAGLIGHVDGWPQAQTAARLAGRYFFASGVLVAAALTTLWWHTGVTSVSAVPDELAATTPTVVLAAGALLVLAAMVQSALIPFHTWLLSSMTAPTPASALMHAGFVNAGGILLVRFAPVVSSDAGLMLAIVAVGAASAIFGKLLKTVQTDVKRALGCSTIGQMGFMILQAGLGFFAAAVAHLVLHGFYKAYQFLSSGDRVEHTSPAADTEQASTGVLDGAIVTGTAVAGGVVFAVLTGKGTSVDTGLLLTLLVVVTVLHAARETIARAALSPRLRYGAVPLVAIPAIAVYALVYRAFSALLGGLPAVGDPAALGVGHVAVALAFLAAYVAIETGVYRRSTRLYVALMNATQPPTNTQLTTTEEYDAS